MSRAVVLPALVYLGLDTVHEITDRQCEALVTHGVSWLGLYTRPDAVVLDHPTPGGDWSGCHSVSHAISRRVLGHGLMIAPLQFGAWGGGVTAAAGNRLGLALRSSARQLGIPVAVHLWADYEGQAVVDAGAVAGVAALEALAAAACPDLGESLGLYHSLGHPLTAAQLHGLRGITSYWGAANRVPDPWPRGHSIRQGAMRAGYRSSAHPRWCGELGRDCPVPAETFGPEPVCPVAHVHGGCLIPIGAPGHDPNILRPDYLGDMPILWAA